MRDLEFRYRFGLGEREAALARFRELEAEMLAR